MTAQKRQGLLIAMLLGLCGLLVWRFIPEHDTLYYLDWSRHIASGYFDGPPGIAFYLRGLTTIVGSSTHAITFIGLLSHVLIGLLVAYLAKSLFDKTVATTAFFIWFLSPAMFATYGLRVTYDTPACLFAVLTLHAFYLFSQKNRAHYIYLAAIAAGLMLLSKLTGTVLLLGIFALLFAKPYRHCFKSPHLYIATGLIAAIVMPVLLLGKQGSTNLWVQLQHGLGVWSWHNLAHIGSYLLINLALYNVLLVLFFYGAFTFRHQLNSNPKLSLIYTPSVVIFGFYLLTSLSRFNANWNDLFYMTAPIAIAAFVQQSAKIKKTVNITLSTYAVILIIAVLVMTNMINPLNSQQLLMSNQEHALAKELKPFIGNNKNVFSNNFALNAVLDQYVPRQQPIYSFANLGHQYQFWSEQANQQLKKRALPSLIFLTTDTNKPLIAGYLCQHQYSSQHGIGQPRLFFGATQTVYLYRCHLTPIALLRTIQAC